MFDLENNEELQVNFIESLIEPHIPTSVFVVDKKQRARSAPTKIKSLYHLFQLHKNIEKKGWTEIYQCQKTIKNGGNISIRHFKEFTNSADFSLMGSVEHREFTSNIYRLNPWVVRLFEFLEAKGMMKKFRSNFSSWKSTFLKRVHNWLLPLLRKQLSLKDILMNRVTNKKSLKGLAERNLKGLPINHYVTDKAPKGEFRTNIGTQNRFSKSKEKNSLQEKEHFDHLKDIELGIQEHTKVALELASRIGMGGADIKHFLSKNSLPLVKKATRILCSRIEKLNFKPISKVRSLQSIINKLRKVS